MGIVLIYSGTHEIIYLLAENYLAIDVAICDKIAM